MQSHQLKGADGYIQVKSDELPQQLGWSFEECDHSPLEPVSVCSHGLDELLVATGQTAHKNHGQPVFFTQRKVAKETIALVCNFMQRGSDIEVQSTDTNASHFPATFAVCLQPSIYFGKKSVQFLFTLLNRQVDVVLSQVPVLAQCRSRVKASYHEHVMKALADGLD